MFIFTTWALRVLGLAGILGGILFICGDLSYGHVPGSKESPTVKMSKMPEGRLLRAGTLGMLGCWLYVLGALHVYLAMRSVGDVFAIIFVLAFAAVMINFGISHTAYFSIASGAKAAIQNGGEAEAGGKLGNRFFQRMVNITYIPVGISSLMMLYGVGSGRSLYPWWMVFFLPVILYGLKVPVVKLLRGRAKELVNDCYDNLSLFVFFVISTIVLWNGVPVFLAIR